MLLFPGIGYLGVVAQLRAALEASCGAGERREAGSRIVLRGTVVEVVFYSVDDRIGRFPAQRRTARKGVRNTLEYGAFVEDVDRDALERRAVAEHACNSGELARADEKVFADRFQCRATVEYRTERRAARAVEDI